MTTLHDFPFFPLEFTKEGQVFKSEQEDALRTFLEQAAGSAGPITDLLVLSHGWNNDTEEAGARYDCLLRHLRPYVQPGRRFAAVGLFWPSKKFADDELIPGGGASLGAEDDTEALLLQELSDLRGCYDAPQADDVLARAQALVPHLGQEQAARTEFADLMKTLLAGVHAPTAEATNEATALQNASSAALVEELGRPLPVTMLGPVRPGTAGAAAGLGQFFGGIKAGARNLLNFTTYYQMKERAGLVGRQGLRPVLTKIAARWPQLRLHLVGHSFGGRLVTSAASGQQGFRVSTLTLLQTAFSHNGFSNNYDGDGSAGLFRPLVTDKTVTGPVLITHAAADFAVGRMYPLASRVAGQEAAFLGGPDDPYGGLGRNGAQKTPEASFGALLPASDTYDFQAGRLHNLHGDDVINNKAIISGHGDICGPEIASAIMQAIATT